MAGTKVPPSVSEHLNSPRRRRSLSVRPLQMLLPADRAMPGVVPDLARVRVDAQHPDGLTVPLDVERDVAVEGRTVVRLRARERRLEGLGRDLARPLPGDRR